MINLVGYFRNIKIFTFKFIDVLFSRKECFGYFLFVCVSKRYVLPTFLSKIHRDIFEIKKTVEYLPFRERLTDDFKKIFEIDFFNNFIKLFDFVNEYRKCEDILVEKMINSYSYSADELKIAENKILIFEKFANFINKYPMH